jgi:DNA topoisomerase IA
VKKNDDHLQLPVTSKQILSFFISAIPVIAVGGYLYAEFENRLDKIEQDRLEDRAQIEELVQKHERESEQRFEAMEEQVKWYQKELGFNLNPFSRKKKK